jgi:autotransporter translocation and assembly factor TamB
MNDPQVHLTALVSAIRLADQPFSDLHLDAHTGNHQVAYTLRSQQSAGDLEVSGNTHLDAQMQTAATMTLRRFDLGAALKLMHVTGITGQSDWEGTAHVSGPLAHPKQMSGEASLRQLSAVLEGVHLSSQGAVHALLAHGIAHLDPV